MHRMIERRSSHVRLDGWGSIAGHLNRCTRTVQRWAKSYQLPIHRLGSDSRTVFAYTDEIDQWMRLGPVHRKGISLQLEFPKQPKMPSPAAAQPRVMSIEDHRGADRAETMLGTGQDLHAPGRVVTATTKPQYLDGLLDQIATKWKNYSSSNLHSITRLYREVIDLDFKNPAAHAGLGQSVIAGVLVGNLRAAQSYRIAQDAVRTALELQNDHPDALCASAWLSMMVEHDFKRAKSLFGQLLSLRQSVLHASLGMALAFIAERKAAEGAELLREYSEAYLPSPIPTALHIWTEYLAQNSVRARTLMEHARLSGFHGTIFDIVDGFCAIDVMNPAAAAEHIQQLTDESPYNALLQGLLGYAHARSGNQPMVDSIIELLQTEAIRLRFDTAYPSFLVYAGNGNRRTAVQWLEQSYAEGSLWGLAAGCDPILADLGSDPNYQLFLSRIRYSSTDES